MGSNEIFRRPLHHLLNGWSLSFLSVGSRAIRSEKKDRLRLGNSNSPVKLSYVHYKKSADCAFKEA